MGVGTCPSCSHGRFFFFPGPITVLVPLIKINKETTKLKKKKRGSSKWGRSNFETWKYPPAQPHRKA